MVYLIATIAFLWLLNRLVLIERTNKGGRPRWSLRFRKQSLQGALMKIIAVALTDFMIVKLLADSITWARLYWQSILLLTVAVTIVILAWHWLPRLIATTMDVAERDPQTLDKARGRWNNEQNNG